MANKKAWGIAAVVIAGAGLMALAARFNDEAADKPQEKSFAQQCSDTAARQRVSVLDGLCVAAGYGPANPVTP